MSQKILILHADHNTNVGLNTWARNAGFDISSSWGGRPIRSGDYFDFHITILASQNDISDPNFDVVLPNPIEVTADCVTTIGNNSRFPILKLARSWKLDSLWSSAVSEGGWVPTFPYLLPHISLSYNWDGNMSHMRWIQLPDFPLTFNRLVQSDFSTGEPASLKEWYLMTETLSTLVLFVKVDGHWRKDDIITNARTISDIRTSLQLQGTPSVVLEVPSNAVRALDNPKLADDAVRSRRYREASGRMAA